MTSDPDLVHAARHGDAAGLAALLTRHRAAMQAVAVSLLGWGPDAEDAVQDAMLVALQRLDELRDPAAAGPWLKAITRNNARMRLRSSGRIEPLDDDFEAWPSMDQTPEEVLDRHALRDWVWTALETLSDVQQVVVLLRYFTDASSYEQIAKACGVPVGTVRSRLNDARRRLTTALLSSATAAHDETASTVTERRSQMAYALIESAARGEFARTLAQVATTDMELVGPQRQQARGPGFLIHVMESDLDAGVRQRPIRATAGRRITVLECELLNPAWDPEHCPPGVLWLMKHTGDRVDHITLFHPEPTRDRNGDSTVRGLLSRVGRRGLEPPNLRIGPSLVWRPPAVAAWQPGRSPLPAEPVAQAQSRYDRFMAPRARAPGQPAGGHRPALAVPPHALRVAGSAHRHAPDWPADDLSDQVRGRRRRRDRVRR